MNHTEVTRVRELESSQHDSPICSKMFQMHNAFSGGKENKPNKAHVFDFSNQFANLLNNFSCTKIKNRVQG